MAHIRRRPLQAIPPGHPLIREKNRQLSKSIRTPFGFDCFVYYIKTLVPWLLYHPVSEILFDINACNKSQLFYSVFKAHIPKQSTPHYLFECNNLGSIRNQTKFLWFR